VEALLRRKSGEIATVLCSAERITLKGKVCAIVGSVDITDRRQAEGLLSRRIAFHERIRHLR
jgi:hypothetical protein